MNANRLYVVFILFVLSMVLSAATGRCQSVLNVSQYKLVFEENFTSLNLRSPSNPDGRWDTKFQFGGRTLSNNGEMEIYVDPEYLGLGLNPFSLRKEGLVITAKPVNEALKARLGGEASFISGLLTTEHSFFQTYGYFEMRARLPAGKGLWPAFWLLPENKTWPPEIDIFEVLGDRPDIAYMTIHSTVAQTVGFKVPVTDVADGYHTYGLLWGRQEIAWYFDGREVARAPTPADLHIPMYLLINLAVGGHWPGAPDGSTRFPAELAVSYVRAYATPETIGRVEPGEKRVRSE